MDLLNRLLKSALLFLMVVPFALAQPDSLNITHVSGFNTNGGVYNMHQEDDLLTIAQAHGGAMWVDMEFPQEPDILREFDEAIYSCADVFVLGDTLFMLEPGEGVHLINFSNPDNVYSASTFGITQSCNSLDVEGDLMVVLGLQSGLFVIDWTSPEPTISHWIDDALEFYHSVDLIGTTAYVSSDDRLMAIDCSDVENPVRVGTYYDQSLDAFKEFVIQENIAYLPYIESGHDAIVTVDVSDPTDMQQLAWSETVDLTLVGGMAIEGDYLYITHHFYEPGFSVYNCSDVENIYQTGYYDTEGTNDPMGKVVVDGEYAYVGYWVNSDFGWVDVFDVSEAQIQLDAPEHGAELPAVFTVLPAYPNPFNATMSVPFELARSGEVTVSLYNSLGRQVYREVLNRHAGQHRVQLAPHRNLASGQYLLRLSSGGAHHSQKVVLLK